MATDVHTSLPPDRIQSFLDDLGDILAGTKADRGNVRRGFAARLAFTFLGLVKLDYQQLGRGEVATDGSRWEPLSASYLAYSRPIKGRGRPKAGKAWPGGKDGFMTQKQVKQWRRDFAQAFAWLSKKYNEKEAAGKAAAIATNRYKRAGGKVKISDRRFGGRQVGVDYQTLVDTGALRNSLLPGTVAGDDYNKPSDDQVFEPREGEVTVGTKDRKAAFHHLGKGRRKRRFWPEALPATWRDEIAEQGDAGVARAVELIRAGQL